MSQLAMARGCVGAVAAPLANSTQLKVLGNAVQLRRPKPVRRLRGSSLAVRASAEAPASAEASIPALLKTAAETKQVPAKELVSALVALEKAAKGAKAPSDETLLEGLGGTKSPGKLWRLVFTANGKTDPSAASGNYFPIFAAQRFDAAALEIENGVFFGPFGYLTFKGPFSFKSRRLSFLFHTLTLKLGPLPELTFDISSEKTKGRKPGEGKEGREDPFFVWFHVDDDVVAGRGRGGGVAFWNKHEGPYK